MFMHIPGENLCGVYSANEFLTRINLMKAYKDGSDTVSYTHLDVYKRQILSSSDLVQEVPVALSNEASYVSTHAAEDISCLLPDNVEPDMLERTVTLTNDTDVYKRQAHNPCPQGRSSQCRQNRPSWPCSGR